MKLFKSLIALILIVTMCFSIALVASASENEPILILGDADRDSKVNIKDATAIQKHVAGLVTLTNNGVFLADVDADLQITVKDATVIQKYVASMPVSQPVGEEVVPEEPPCTEPSEAPTEATEPTVVPTEATEPTVVPTEATEPTVVPTEATEPTTPDIPEEKMNTNITIYFSNNVNWSTVNAYLYNEAKGIENATWPGLPMTYHSTNGFGEKIYKMDVDVSQYNRVVFNNGRSQTLNAALSVASSGFYISDQSSKTAMQLGIYAFDETDYGTMKTVYMDYPDGYKKPIYIKTPAGYDATDTSKRYKVIYLLDGQNQFTDMASTATFGIWATDKITTSIQHNGGEGIILVGIDNCRNRDNELTPDIGNIVHSEYTSSAFDNGSGEKFSNFVVDTVVSYIRDNYNVSTDPEDNMIMGSSSGGIEAFYIGMENMDVFGSIGSLSPAFVLYDKSDWDKYLSKFDFTDHSKLPRIYFYNGGGDPLEMELYPYAKAMPEWMAALGYPKDKMIFAFDDKNAHNEAAWRCVAPEIIAWLFEL